MKSVGIKTMASALIATALMLGSGGCGGEIDSKNMEQHYLDNGVPVRTEVLKSSAFAKTVEFNAVISGIKESSAFAAYAEKVEQINYQVGDFVEKDAIVLTFPTDNPKAKYFQAKLAYENARASFERMENYYKSGGLSRQNYENSETSFKVAEADWNSIKQSVKVKAPISGVLTRINVRETENVDEEAELFTIAQIDKIKARVWVSDNDINSISKGQRAFAEWNGKTEAGKVVQVDMSKNQMKKAFAVDLEFDNSQNQIKSGVTANIVIEVYQSSEAIIIERKNMIKNGDEFYVFLNQNGMAKKQVVEVGRTSGIDVEILSGLKYGDELIVEGQMLLSDNMKINLVTD